MAKFGERLKRFRAEISTSQRDIAEKLGIPQTTWSNYECNKSEPNFALINKICTEFSLNVEWLIFGTGPMRRREPGGDIPAAHDAFSATVVFDVVETLEELLRAQERDLAPNAKAEVVCRLCRLIAAQSGEGESLRPGQILRLIQSALAEEA